MRLILDKCFLRNYPIRTIFKLLFADKIFGSEKISIFSGYLYLVQDNICYQIESLENDC